MAQKKAHEVDRFLSRLEKNFPIVLIYGPDKGLVSERANIYAALTEIALDDPFSNIRLEAIDIEKDTARLEDEAYTMSLFGGNRLIWIRNATNQKGLIEAMKTLLKTPPPQTYVLIEAGDLKKGTGIRNLIETASTAMALPCFQDDARALDGLIDQVLEENTLTLSLEARKWLRESLGSDRLISRGELEKLCLYAKGKNEIQLDDVKEVVSDVSALSQDEIIDAMLIGDLKNFNDQFDRYIATGSPLFLILNAALRQFQQLQLLRQSIEFEGKTPFSVVAAARPPIFFRRQKLVERALAHWSSKTIAQAMIRLQKTVFESRENTHLSEAITRQALLALTLNAKHHS
ncbi:DNA polymerase III subunit delta [Bartonella tamiae]|uniref:DNA polymerase III subunit delta n=1 Tax=Bartonella tamiae Th239 TaxID=1094558 RepID=J0R763_9HYPH|nr:DNA polymerase III subunit delta [Bartonella tamiae]EJF91574.1 DNA polymerase III, delta subunit [Bartonella tamiae Th239]EJF92442.1 DNA polymerase III, delta subunit [Bartonella tamiae Th307]